MSGREQRAQEAARKARYRQRLKEGGGGGLGFNVGAGGDQVGVMTAWSSPDPLDGITVGSLRAAQAAVREGGPWRESFQAKDWVGRPIARALKLDPDHKPDRAKVSRLLKLWTENGMFRVVGGKDANHETRRFVEVGEPAND